MILPNKHSKLVNKCYSWSAIALLCMFICHAIKYSSIKKSNFHPENESSHSDCFSSTSEVVLFIMLFILSLLCQHEMNRFTGKIS